MSRSEGVNQLAEKRHELATRRVCLDLRRAQLELVNVHADSRGRGAGRTPPMKAVRWMAMTIGATLCDRDKLHRNFDVGAISVNLSVSLDAHEVEQVLFLNCATASPSLEPHPVSTAFKRVSDAPTRRQESTEHELELLRITDRAACERFHLAKEIMDFPKLFSHYIQKGHLWAPRRRSAMSG